MRASAARSSITVLVPWDSTILGIAVAFSTLPSTEATSDTKMSDNSAGVKQKERAAVSFLPPYY
jgi:hypothetical protein